MNPLMKIPIALSVLILAAAASLRWYDSQRLTAVRESHAKLVAQAATLGIFPGASRRNDSTRDTRHGRRDDEINTTKVLAEFVAFAKEMEASGKALDSPVGADKQRMKEMMDRVSLLSPAQLKILITGVGVAKDLKDPLRLHLITFSLNLLTSDHPRTALEIFAESPNLLGNNTSLTACYVKSPLTNLAEEDPAAALEWIRKNTEKYPDRVMSAAKEGVISGIAENDPKLAFKALRELGLQDNYMALLILANAGKTPKIRTAIFAAIRDYQANSPEDQTAKMMTGIFTGKLASEGFAPATQWFAGANFTPSELETVVSSLSGSIKTDETSQWIDWVSEKRPAEKSERHIRKIVAKWTENDFQAAGKWLASTPASPTKNTAIRSYAETVSKYDPATATQWAMTLPPGPDRDATLKHIQDHLPAK